MSPEPPATFVDERSSALYREAVDLLPGGVNSPVRSMSQIGRDPLFLVEGSGCRVTDADGNEFIDWMASWGPLVLGHAHPRVVEAVRGAAGRGTTFGAPTEQEIDLAREVVERVPSVEMIRMTSSGTEAAMTAVRLARASTGREVVVKFAGAYHGHVDGLLAAAGSGLATHGIPSSPGVTEAQAGSTVVVGWNDPSSVDRALQEHEVAAVICEPVAANMGVVPPIPGFLERLRELCDAAGALLVFDEVISGFRVARGGAQEARSVMPDLTIMGKILGGGLPAAAIGGPRRLIERLAPSGPVYQAGTLSGNPLAVAAGLATLAELDEGAYSRLGVLTDMLADGLEEAALIAGAPVVVQRDRGLVTPFFSLSPVHDFEGASAADGRAYARFCRGLLARGVYPPPSPFEAWFVSLAHDEDAIGQTVEAARDAMAEALR